MELKDKFKGNEVRRIPFFKILGRLLIIVLVAYLMCRIFMRQIVTGINFFIWIAVFILFSLIAAISLWKIGNFRSAVLSYVTVGILCLLGIVYYFLFIP